MPILLEFVRPYGWIPLIAMLVMNGILCVRFGGRALLLTIPLVGIVYCALDISWIRSEMARAGWDGQPDQDGIFLIGMMLRAAIAAILLLMSSVAVFGVVAVTRNRRRKLSATPAGLEPLERDE